MPNEPAIESEVTPRVFICMHLDVEVLDELTRFRLTKAGVESIQDAGPGRAYALIERSTRTLAKVASQLHIKQVWFEDPPSA